MKHLIFYHFTQIKKIKMKFDKKMLNILFKLLVNWYL